MQWVDLFYLELKCSLLLVAAGLLCLVFRRGSAAQRHMAWSLAMVGAILIPLVVLTFPQWKLPVLPEPPVAKNWIQVPVASDTPVAVEQPCALAETAPVVDSKPLPAMQSEPKKRPAPSAGAILTGLWGLGGCMVLLSMGIGMFAVGRMVGKARPADPAWMQRLLRLRKRLGIARPVELLETKGPSMPIAVGLLRHRIMLPKSGRDWPAKEQEAVLAHELAHIKRRDCLLHFISTIALALHWFNPLFWYAMRRMRLEREHACDDHVLGVGAEPAAYADQLLTIARTMPCRIPLLGVAITMARKNALEGRLLAILDSARNRKALGLRTIAVALLLLAGIAASLAAITSVGDKKIVPFDFDNPPMAYEKKIRMAKPDHSIKAGGLRFKLSDVTRSANGTLNASLGLKDGYEVVSLRLFDHEARDFFHDSQWQLNTDNPPSTRKFNATREGETDRIRIEETGGTLPASLDLWLRIVENGPGERFLIPAREGASAKHGKSEVAITFLHAGMMNGKGSPSGMAWDTSTAQDTNGVSTVNLENRGKILRGRYHLVAVTKKGWRHPMNHKHFIDFSRGSPHSYARLDVAPDQIDHFELIPFKTRHKFFFNGVEVPKRNLSKAPTKVLVAPPQWDASYLREIQFDAIGVSTPIERKNTYLRIGGAMEDVEKAARAMLDELGLGNANLRGDTCSTNGWEFALEFNDGSQCAFLWAHEDSDPRLTFMRLEHEKYHALVHLVPSQIPRLSARLKDLGFAVRLEDQEEELAATIIGVLSLHLRGVPLISISGSEYTDKARDALIESRAASLAAITSVGDAKNGDGQTAVEKEKPESDREAMLGVARALESGDFATLENIFEFQDDLSRRFAQEMAGMFAQASDMSVELISMERLPDQSLFTCFLMRNGPERFGSSQGPFFLTFHRKDGRWRCPPIGDLRTMIGARNMGAERLGRRVITQQIISMRFSPQEMKDRTARTKAQANAFARLAGPPYNLSQFEEVAELMKGVQEKTKTIQSWEDAQRIVLEGPGEDALPRPGDFYLCFYLEAGKDDPNARTLPFADGMKSFLLEPFPCLTDDAVLKAGVGMDPTGNTSQIDITLTQGGAKIFEALTRESIGKRLAIVIDGKVVSAPAIMAPIPGGKAVITGRFSRKEAESIAEKLNAYRKAAGEFLDALDKEEDVRKQNSAPKKTAKADVAKASVAWGVQMNQKAQSAMNHLAANLMGLRSGYPAMDQFQEMEHEVSVENSRLKEITINYERNFSFGTKVKPAGPLIAGKPWCRIAVRIRPDAGEASQLEMSAINAEQGIRWDGQTNIRGYRVTDLPMLITIAVETGSPELRREINQRIDTQLTAMLQKNPWGDPVNGFAVRLRPETLMWTEGTLPKLSADLRNQGAQDLHISNGPEIWAVEIDGQWIRSTTELLGGRIYAPLQPGGLQENTTVRLLDGDNLTRKLKSLASGKHTLRVECVLTDRNPPHRELACAVSNPVEIEVASVETESVPNADIRRMHQSRKVTTGRAVDAETGVAVEQFVIQDRLPMAPDYVGPALFGGETRSAGGFRDGKFPIRSMDTYENGERVEEGLGECRLIADGYLPEHVIVPDGHPDGEVFVVRLKRGNMIRGRVLDHTGKPVANAGIYLSAGHRVIELDEAPHSEFQESSVRTDADGRFEMSGGGEDSQSIFVTAPSLFIWRADLPKPGREAMIRLPEPAMLHIRYDIEGAPEEAQVRIELRTWDMPKWKGAVNVERWVDLVVGKDGLLIENLPPGVYDISRIKHLRTAASGTDAMLDRNLALTLESGKTAEYNFVRSTGAPISGEIIGLPDKNVDGVFVYVKPVGASGDPRNTTGWKLPTFDGMGLDGNGQFTTERIAPGQYKIIATAYRTETPEERISSGLRLPAWVGTATVTVPEAGNPPSVRVEMKPYPSQEAKGIAKVEENGASALSAYCGAWVATDHLPVSMLIRADGKVVVVAGIPVASVEATWSADAGGIRIEAEGGSVGYAEINSDGKLVFMEADETTLFERVEDPSVDELVWLAESEAHPPTAKDEALYCGSWKMGGSDPMQMVIKPDGTVVFAGSDQCIPGNWTVKGDTIVLQPDNEGQPPGIGWLKNGLLIVKVDGDEMIFRRQEEEASSIEIIVMVNKDGQATISGEQIAPQDLAAQLKRITKNGRTDASVLIKLDEQSRHEHVVRVLDACQTAGIDRVSFITEEEAKVETVKPVAQEAISAFLGEWVALDRYAEPDGRMQIRVEKGGSALLYGIDMRMRAQWTLNVDELVFQTADGVLTADIGKDGLLVLRQEGKAVMKLKRPGAVEEDQPTTQTKKEIARQLEARLNATQRIASFSKRDKALTNIAVDAGQHRNLQVALTALGRMASFSAKDEAASQCADRFIAHGMSAEATQVANTMASFSAKDQVLVRIAQGTTSLNESKPSPITQTNSVQKFHYSTDPSGNTEELQKQMEQLQKQMGNMIESGQMQEQLEQMQKLMGSMMESGEMQGQMMQMQKQMEDMMKSMKSK